MSGLEALGAVVGVVAVVAQVISAYRDGGGIVDRIKEKRAAKRGRPLPRQLEESVKETPDDIEREKNRGLAKFGHAFEQGDYIAIITIQQIAIQVHSKFFENLRTAYDDDTDFTSLINEADMGRNNTLRALIELQQRLHVAAPMQSAPLFSQTPLQTIGQRAEREVSVARIGTVPRAEDRQRNLLESSPWGPANPEAPVRDQRLHRFPLFRRAREHTGTGQDSPAHASEPAQSSLGRVHTIPTNSSSAPDDWQPLRNVGSMETQVGVTHSRLPPQTPGQSPMQINEPWDNPWAEDTPQPSTYTTQPDHAMPMDPPARTFTSRSGSSTSSMPIPHPNPSNNYMGFCKGAWKLQDGDRNAMVASRDYTMSAQSTFRILRCSECKFEGHFNPEKIWTLVFKFENMGMKIRWSFLAKSHVRQKYPQPRDLAKNCDFTYQCIFCAFLGIQGPVIHGAKAYRNHISQQHHGTTLSDVVLYKSGAVDHRICDDCEDFDINLYPRRSSQVSELSGMSL